MKVSAGCEIFDAFLEGGIETDTLTTIYGPGGSGKTTLCMLASLQRAREGKKTIYIDTEGGFSLERLRQLAGAQFDKLFAQIVVLKPTSFDEQNAALKKLGKLVSARIGLIVVDTMTLFYRLEQARNREIKQNNNILIWQINYLVEIARKQDIPVLVTNQVYADFANKEDVRMVGGDILRVRSKCLIKLEKESDNKRKATLITHRSIPEGKEMEFAIINEGLIET